MIMWRAKYAVTGRASPKAWRFRTSSVISADDQNKSPEDETDTISVTTCYVRFLYLGYVEENVSYVLFSSDFKFVLLPPHPQHCVCVYVCIPEVLSFECKIK